MKTTTLGNLPDVAALERAARTVLKLVDASEESEEGSADAQVASGERRFAMTPFKLACFCVLMDHHREGVEAAHPDYLQEKFNIISQASDEIAFTLLDASNQARVLDWCQRWNVDASAVRQFLCF